MSGKISSFKIESYGSIELGVDSSKPGRGEITHKYYSVPTSVVRKLINAKSTPCISDFESWLSAAREKDMGVNEAIVCGGITFWSSKD